MASDSEYLYFINNSQEIRRLPIDGPASEVVYTAPTNSLTAIAVTPAGDAARRRNR